MDQCYKHTCRNFEQRLAEGLRPACLANMFLTRSAASAVSLTVASSSLLNTNSIKVVAAKETINATNQLASLNRLRASSASASQTTCMAALTQAELQAYALYLIALGGRRSFAA